MYTIYANNNKNVIKYKKIRGVKMKNKRTEIFKEFFAAFSGILPIIVIFYLLIYNFSFLKWYIISAALLGIVIEIYKYKTKKEHINLWKHLILGSFYPIILPILVPPFIILLIVAFAYDFVYKLSELKVEKN
jgi:hypothetical protein